MNSFEIQKLFQQASIGSYEDDEAWEAVFTLQKDGNREIFDRAVAWLQSPEALKRARAAAILAQLRAPNEERLAKPEWLFREEASLLIVEMLRHESDVVVLSSAVSTLGHLEVESAIPVIESYKSHSDDNVRFHVTCALGHFCNHPLAVPVLLELTSDLDADVRDWSVFGLGVLGDADSPAIREALLQRASDIDEDVREEAAVGLGKRQDVRLLPILRKMLNQSELKTRVAEAAAALLGLAEESDEWGAEEYKQALDRKFGNAEHD